MSKAVSALSGAEFQGFVTVAETGLRGMITLRGDLGSAAVTAAVASVTGCKVPETGRINWKRSRGVAWMSPDELLIFGPYGKVAQDVATLSAALSGSHHLVANVSDARAVFRISGQQSRDIVAKLSPVNVAAVTPGMFRRTRFAQVPAAFHMPDANRIEIICFRSVGKYMFDLLSNAIKNGPL